MELWGDSKPKWPLRQEAGGFGVDITIPVPGLVWEIYVFVAGILFPFLFFFFFLISLWAWYLFNQNNIG